MKMFQIMKNGFNIRPFYPKEFIDILPKEFNDVGSGDFNKIYVRGYCFGFSPTIINKYLG